MSGGALNYSFRQVRDTAELILERARSPLEKAFARHLKEVAEVLRCVEWWYSEDSNGEAAIEAMKSLLGERGRMAQVEILREELGKLIKQAIELKESL